MEQLAIRRIALAAALLAALAASALALVWAPWTDSACTVDPISLAGGLPSGISDRDRSYLEGLSGRTVKIPADRLTPLKGAHAVELCILAYTSRGWEPLHFTVARAELAAAYEPAARLTDDSMLVVNMPTLPPLPLEGVDLPWQARGATALYVLRVPHGSHTYPLLIVVGGEAERLGCGAIPALSHGRVLRVNDLPIAGDPPWPLERALRNLTGPDQALELLAAAYEGPSLVRAEIEPGPVPPPSQREGWVLAWAQDLATPEAVLGGSHGDTWSFGIPLVSEKAGPGGVPAGIVLVIQGEPLESAWGVLAGTVRVFAGERAWERGFILSALEGAGTAVVPIGLGEPWGSAKTARVEVRVSAAPGQAWLLRARAGAVYIVEERPERLEALSYEALYEPVRTVDTVIPVRIAGGERSGAALVGLLAPSRLALDASAPQTGPTLRLRLHLPEGFPGGTLRVSGVPLAVPVEARIPAASDKYTWETTLALPPLGGAAAALSAASPASTAVVSIVLDQPAPKGMEIRVEAETLEPARLPALPLRDILVGGYTGRLPLLDPVSTLAELGAERGLRYVSLVGPKGPVLVEARISSSTLLQSLEVVLKSSHAIKEAWATVELMSPEYAGFDAYVWASLRLPSRPEWRDPGTVSRMVSAISWSASPGSLPWEYAGKPWLESQYSTSDSTVRVWLHAYPTGWALDDLGDTLVLIVGDIIMPMQEHATVRLAGATLVVEGVGRVDIGPTSPSEAVLGPGR